MHIHIHTHLEGAVRCIVKWRKANSKKTHCLSPGLCVYSGTKSYFIRYIKCSPMHFPFYLGWALWYILSSGLWAKVTRIFCEPRHFGAILPPLQSLSSYKATSGWDNYKMIEPSQSGSLKWPCGTGPPAPYVEWVS